MEAHKGQPLEDFYDGIAVDYPGTRRMEMGKKEKMKRPKLNCDILTSWLAKSYEHQTDTYFGTHAHAQHMARANTN